MSDDQTPPAPTTPPQPPTPGPVPPAWPATPSTPPARPFASYPAAPAPLGAVPPAPAQPASAQPVSSETAAVQPASEQSGPVSRRLGAGTWVGLSALSLVLGLSGGYVGARLGDDTSAGSGLLPTSVRTEAPLPAADGSVAAVAAELLPSTVQVLAGSGESSGTGSGFVLDDRGHVVTNNHVVAGAVRSGTIVVVDSQGRDHRAEVVGRSTVYDLAVLKVKSDAALQPASLGSSVDLAVGDPVVAFGAPLGLSQTVTSGIVSALDRPVTTGRSNDDSSFINAVQTDAAINPGNSGGALVDLRGRVVGVNSAIATTGGVLGESGNIGVGFAIPVEQVVVTADQILRTGEAKYPVIGASVDTRDDSRQGALIDTVRRGGPADDAGLADGDVVVAVDGVRVTDGIQLIVRIRTHQPGESIELEVRQGDSTRTVSVELGAEVG